MIYLDIDGVLANFVKGCGKLFKREDIEVTQWNIFELYGIKEKEFWNIINNDGWKFWFELDFYPEAYDILEICQRFDNNVLLCSSPSISPDCVKGKLMWIHKYFPKLKTRYIFTNSKEFLNPIGIMVDDSDININRFRMIGGSAILYPRPWNKNKEIKNPLSYLENCLRALA